MKARSGETREETLSKRLSNWLGQIEGNLSTDGQFSSIVLFC